MRANPLLSIILPVLNESETINRTILALRKTGQGGPLEIIVVDGDPLGGTIRAITAPDVRTAIKTWLDPENFDATCLQRRSLSAMTARIKTSREMDDVQ